MLWAPTPEQIAAAQVTRFREFVEQRWHIRLDDYAALHDWAVRESARFWQSLWEFSGVVAHRDWDNVVVDFDRMPGARWFVGAELNFAENLMLRRDDRPAIIFRNESGARRQLSWRELHASVARVAAGLQRLGMQPGDRVVGFLPNIPEAVVAMLATASLGGVWSLCSPDFGLQGVLDRFGQIAPRVMFAVDGYTYSGKTFDCLDRVAEISRRLPSVEQVVVIPYGPSSTGPSSTAVNNVPDAVAWNDFIDPAADELDFRSLAFSHPLYILYSSGTTGVPKCIVHGAGGTLLKHLQELRLHVDLNSDDRIFYYTTTGWMMWNWLVSSLAVGATIVVFDGSPFTPTASTLFDLIEQENVNIFGTSPKFLSSIEKAGMSPQKTHNLGSLRTILSTGSPLLPESYEYVYREIKPNVRLSSMSGGTDLIGSFAQGSPVLPVYRGEMQTRALGMHVDVLDDEGRSLVGIPGELVCRNTFPSMPIGFWNDPGDEKYHEAYFARYPHCWRHGDWAELTPRGGMIIYGRSDAVLNPGGVRIGTAEIYQQVEQLPEILESLVIGQQFQGDVRIVLFVKLRPDAQLNEALAGKIRHHIRVGTTPRHVPAKIIQVPDIPRTKSGKIVELAVRDIVHGRPIKNAEALANPESLEHFRSLPELAC